MGVQHLPWWSGPTVDSLGYIVFSGHVAALESSTWWGRVLFTTQLEIVAWAPCLHTVVRGTPVSGYLCFRVPTVTRVIKKKHSTGLSDRLREKGLE
jgi:hypothetical protein